MINLVADVVVLDEPAGPPDGDLVDHVEQVLRGQVVRVDGHRPVEVALQRGDSRAGERGVVGDEVGDQRVQVVEAVVDRGRGQQHQVLRGPGR